MLSQTAHVSSLLCFKITSLGLFFLLSRDSLINSNNLVKPILAVKILDMVYTLKY